MSVLSATVLSYFYFELHPPLLSAGLSGGVNPAGEWRGAAWEFGLTPAGKRGVVSSAMQRALLGLCGDTGGILGGLEPDTPVLEYVGVGEGRWGYV